MRITVITVLYDAAKYVPELFGTLSRMEKGGHDVRVVAVDNGPTDAAAQMVRRDFPWVELVQPGANLGFAGGNNLALKESLERGDDFAYLLNPDTAVEPDFLLRALETAARFPRAGAVQSLVLLSPERELVNSAGNAIHFLGLGYCLGYRMKAAALRPTLVDGAEIAYPSGAGVLLRVAALREVGLLDESLFMYHEDLDLGWRLRLAGWTNVLSPASAIYHKYEFSRSIKKYFFMERNRYVVLLKHLRAWSLLVLAPWLFLSEFALFAASVRGGWWREKLRVYAHFWKPSTWRQLAAARRKSQRSRKASDREIVRLWTPVVLFQDVTGAFTERVANPLMTALWAVLRPLIR